MKWLLLLLLFVWIPLNDISVSHKEITDPMCIAATLDSEDRTGSLRSRRAIYDVIIERTRRRSLSACDVVLQKSQFSGMTLKKIAQTDKESLTRMWEVVYSVPSCVGCTHFHSKRVNPDWSKKMIKYKIIGSHIFYKIDK